MTTAATTTTTRGVKGFDGRREEVQNVTPPARKAEVDGGDRGHRGGEARDAMHGEKLEG